VRLSASITARESMRDRQDKARREENEKRQHQAAARSCSRGGFLSGGGGSRRRCRRSPRQHGGDALHPLASSLA